MKFRNNQLHPDWLSAYGIKDQDTLGAGFKVLNRVPLTMALHEVGVGAMPLHFQEKSQVGDERVFGILDLETTGFNSDTDEIIEIGIIRGLYSPSEKRITALLSSVCMLQEPSKPLAPIITEVTGLTDEALKGHSIDDNEVARMMEGADFIIAHNASFDRSFFDKRFPQLANFIWACSSKGGDIDWKAAKHRSAGLESLLLDYGYFYDAHRASIDCMATAWLLMIAQERFAELIQSVNQKHYLIKAHGAPFEVKDDLKVNGFQWLPEEKLWAAHVVSDELLSERLTLLARLYPQGHKKALIEEIPPERRHVK